MPSPLDLPRLSRGRSGSESESSDSALAAWAAGTLLLFFITGCSASSSDALPVPDPLPAVLVGAPLCSVGRLGSEAELALVLVELAVPVVGLELGAPAPELELAVPAAGVAPVSELLAGGGLCSTGRSGSLGSAWPPDPESPPPPDALPEPLPVPAEGVPPAPCLR